VDLSILLRLVDEVPDFCRLVQRCSEANSGSFTENQVAVLETAKPYFIAALYQELLKPLLVLVSSAERATKFYTELQFWCLDPNSVWLLPAPGESPNNSSARLQPEASTERLKVLFKLEESQQPFLLIAPIAAIEQKTISRSDFISATTTLSPGMLFKPLELLTKWQEIGYQVSDLTELPGMVSWRGGILDIFPVNSELPLRIEFFGNKIESLRLFDPRSQRSLEPVSKAVIAPATEKPLTGIAIDYLPPDTWLILDEPSEIEFDSAAKLGTVCQLPLPALSISRWLVNKNQTILPFKSVPSYQGRFQAFLEEVTQMLHCQKRVIIVSLQSARLNELFLENGILASLFVEGDRLKHIPPPGTLSLIQGQLSEGWRLNSGAPKNCFQGDSELVLFTDKEIFGSALAVSPERKLTSQKEPDFSVGDYVVHPDYGIGRFNGITKMSVDSVEAEYLVLEYAAGDKLYLPTNQAGYLGRYWGGESPRLSRLGTAEWSRVKQRVKESTRELAQQLLSLYATRQVIPGFAFSPDTIWQEELEASFPYVETPDQIEAVRQVKKDMERAKPMDRLICGDVGYGKTEIGLRAAFKAVMDGKQVAILAPTTVLVQQHFITFSQRLQPFPIKIARLSRFCSKKEQQDILTALVQGSLDICIGTHRLLQKDVKFKDAGLVIIDEEQRFGVVHKERLKQLRKEVDVLTLTATPIPRTLYFSLVGIRDISTMETPPEERLPIKTYVGKYDEALIREAIIQEMGRNGQVFFVHNRIQTIPQVVQQLNNLVPEAKIAIAHGQLAEEELEKAMLEFSQVKVDVLVCTAIIESGLDFPNANTLIVDQAERLGLAQLYQLRGRVGRANRQAYAYFLFHRKKESLVNRKRGLTPEAEKRLQTIAEASELGAGFRIALKDLEIRGAGNLLGSEQSGHIAAVGFGLYSQLLKESIEELKAKQQELVSS
jgi:transcription-repair coupling factor (superfamily II helicase)